MRKIIGPLVVVALAAVPPIALVGAFNAGIAAAQPVPVDAGAPPDGPRVATPFDLTTPPTETGTSPAAGSSGSAGSGSALAPADRIRNPLENPAGAYDDLRAMRRLGWGILALGVAVMLARVLATLGGVFGVLRRGRAALAIAAGTTFAAVAYNAVALGGTWLAALFAGVVAAAAAWDAYARA
jgi:hypothetical protein